MRVLRLTDTGQDVRRWQFFLIGQGLDPGPGDGIFGNLTHQATLDYQQRNGIVPDGVVGNRTLGQAMLQGLEVARETSHARESSQWPATPSFKPLVGTAARQQAFGRFQHEAHPIPGNPENIRVLGAWPAENLTTVSLPQLKGLKGSPPGGKVQFHKRGAAQLQALFEDWEKHDLLDRLITWDGAYVPRFVRGRPGVLSNHAFGSAFDVNATWNALGALPALVGKKGCVRELVEIANANGFYWGGHFDTRPDGMHFEIAQPGG